MWKSLSSLARIRRSATILWIIVVPCAAVNAQQTPTPSLTNFSIGPAEAVLTPGGPGQWDQSLREKVSIIQDETGFRMWYAGSPDGLGTKIGYATSSDGIVWTKYAGNPVVARGSQDHDMCVIKAADGTLYMYIEVNDDHTDLLTSTDGIHWAPYAGNPVKQNATSPVVWREGASWFMLYEYMIGPVLNIHLATSTDGRNWVDSAANPVITESTSTVPDSIVKDGSTYHLYYHRAEAGSSAWPAWHAVSADLTNWTGRARVFTDPTPSSQTVIRTSDGHVLSYVWNLGTDWKYYVRYGLQPLSPTVWHLDEFIGTKAADSSGNGAHASLKNGAQWGPGALGNALWLDGVDDYAATGYLVDLPQWTVSTWVWSPAAPSAAASAGPVHRDGNLQINWNHPGTAYRGAVAVRVGSAWYAASFGTLNPNTWYHLAGTYDGETLRAYKNGQLVTSNLNPSGPARSDPNPLVFGRHAAAANYFVGAVDEVRIYDRALSAAEILPLAQRDNTPPSSPALSGYADGQNALLSWTSSTDAESGVTSYRVYRASSPGGARTQLAVLSGTATSYSDASAPILATSYYQVSAFNGGGIESTLSNEVDVTTGNTAPQAPSGLYGSAGDGRVTLTWQANVEIDVAGYYIHRSATSGGPYVRVTPTLVANTSFMDSGLTNGTTYYYVATAVDAFGSESPPSSQVQTSPTGADPDLVARWRLDDGVGLYASDDSGNGIGGTLTNGPTWTTGRVGGALSLDGTNDFVATNLTQNLSAWTVSVFTRSPAVPAAIPSSGPIHRDRQFQLNWNHPSATFRGAAALSVQGRWYAASFGALLADTWYHLAATYDGETLRAYVNGVLVSSNTAPSGPPDAETFPLRLGAHAAAAQYFNGIVDDARVYRRALSPGEIAGLAGN